MLFKTQQKTKNYKQINSLKIFQLAMKTIKIESLLNKK